MNKRVSSAKREMEKASSSHAEVMRRFITNGWPVLAWMGLIFFLSAQPELPSAKSDLLDVIFKKAGHAVAYGVLMFLTLRALSESERELQLRHNHLERSAAQSRDESRNIESVKRLFTIAFLIVIVYAISDEIHQSFVPNRTSRPMDIVFDMLGACAGTVLFIKWKSPHIWNLFRDRSSFAWLYSLLFIGCVALILALNIDYTGRPAQDGSLLFRDAWFIWGFVYFGFLILPVAVLMIEDGARRGMKWLRFVAPYFALGVVPLSLFLASRPTNVNDRRPMNKEGRITVDARSSLVVRPFWLACLVLAFASLVLLRFGSFDQLLNTMSRNVGWWFMWLDIPLNHLLCLPLVQADMQRRKQTNQTMWLVVVALTGAFGLCAYLWRRKD